MATPATTTSVSEVERPKFEPRTIGFPSEVKESIDKWLHKQIEALNKKNEGFHKNTLKEWRRILEAEPRQKTVSFPFPNAANVVHPLAAETVDDLSARVMQLIFNTSPIGIFQYFTETSSDDELKENRKKATTLEKFIDYEAYQPGELELYPRENEWFTDGAGLGKARVCVVPETRIEQVYVGYGRNEQGKTGALFDDDEELYVGPKIVNLRYEEILIPDESIPFEDNDPIIRRCTLTQKKLKERAFKGHFDKEKVRKILGQPDEYGASEAKRAEEQKKGIQPDNTLALWYIYECYFSWWHNGKKFRLIAWHHQGTNETLNCVYNFIPRNQVPIIETRLSVKGKGFAAMLKDFQEEVSTAKNQRTNAITFGMLGVNTIDPQLAKTVDRNFTLNPGMFIPAKKDGFQHFEMANAAIGALSLQNEQLMVQQAKTRAGVDPAIRGMGAGGMNKKSQYSAMGTLSEMQDGNSRNDHRTSDFRHSHIKLIGMTVDFYGFMGLGSKAKLAGLSQDYLQRALEDWQSRTLQVSMRAASASMNREITKQNLIILNQAVSAYIKETSSLLQALVQNPIPNPEYKKWLFSIITAKTLLMQEIVRQFQISEQVKEFIPDIPKGLFATPEEGAQSNASQGKTGPIDISSLGALVSGRGQG